LYCTLQLSADRHEASRGLSTRAEHLVIFSCIEIFAVSHANCSRNCSYNVWGNILPSKLYYSQLKAQYTNSNQMWSYYIYTVVQKNAPTLADYNYDPVQSILIIFSKLFVNDHKSCFVVKFSISPHICCHYTLWNTVLYFALITLLIARNAPTSDHRITPISVKEF